MLPAGKKNQQQALQLSEYVQRMNYAQTLPELRARYDLAQAHLLNLYTKNYERLKNLGK